MTYTPYSPDPVQKKSNKGMIIAAAVAAVLVVAMICFVALMFFKYSGLQSSTSKEASKGVNNAQPVDDRLQDDYGNAGIQTGNPNLGNRGVETLRKAVPAIANNSDSDIAAAADQICAEMRRGVDPKVAAANFSNQVEGVSIVDGRLFALSASLEFCPDVIDEEALNGGN